MVETDGLAVFNLNTTLSHFSKKLTPLLDEQYNLLKTVSDTIKSSSHFVVLMHHVVWKNVGFDIEPFANSDFSQCNFQSEKGSTFEKSVYPLLQKIQKKGIQVICISGDLGQKEIKKFEAQSKDGIWFLGAGMNQSCVKSTVKDCYLVFHHNVDSRNLSWEFVSLPVLE